MQGESFRLSVKVTAGILVLVAIAGIFEVSARVVFAYQEKVFGNSTVSRFLQRGLILDPYEMPSPKGYLHWVLRPGYEGTRKKLIADKKMQGRYLGAAVLKADVKDQNGQTNDGFRINADGFKGPELDKTHARPRILALGDSTTFGIGAKDYPRHLESILNGRGISVETVNGGVEGYSPRNLIYEIERYKALKPEIVTLYIGWNSLFSEVPWEDAWENRLRAVWLFKRASRTLRTIVGDQQAFAFNMYNRDLKPDMSSSEVQKLRDYTPSFIGNIEKIIDEFESIGTSVVLVTLPGLFTMSATPSPQALKIGHLPYFTKNPFVLAKLTERYNFALRALAARRGLGLVDLEKWGAKALLPREAFFSDSVHLTARGLDMIGVFMAEQLANSVFKNQ